MSAPGTYRPNVGIALFGRDGRVLIARRFADDGPEIVLPGLDWQMPQGGIDPGEDLEAAARRELREETGVTNVTVLGRTPDWLAYDFPPYDVPPGGGPPHRLARFRGQRQVWFAMRFTGDEREIDVATGTESAPPEFAEWRWERLDRVADLVVPFRRDVYRRVAEAFRAFGG